MRKLMIALIATTACLGVSAHAQTTPDSENGRYSFSTVADGTLRLDTRTGQVSLCARQATGWACNAVPDERSALENEIARLQRENGALKIPSGPGLGIKFDPAFVNKAVAVSA